VSWYKKSIYNNYRGDEIQKGIDIEWSEWISDLIDYRDFIIHESLLYSRLTISIKNGHIDVIPPAVPIRAIKSHDYNEVECFEKEFKELFVVGDEEDYDIFWDAFCEYHVELKIYVENIWNKLYSFNIWVLTFLTYRKNTEKV
jgi:hypothetical protein